jgi:hypothetical protein
MKKFLFLLAACSIAFSPLLATDYGAFDSKASRQYKVGDTVTQSGRTYTCIKFVAIPDIKPPANDPDHWSETIVRNRAISVAVSGIDAKAAAATNLLTVLAGVTFYCTGIKVETTSATAITGGASVTAGSTGTAANSLLATTALANSPVVNGYETFSPKAGALAIAPGDVITFTVGTGATGTSQMVRVHLVGYYL